MAELKDPVRARIRDYGLGRAIADEHVFRTIDDAIDAYRASYPDAEWRVREPGRVRRLRRGR